MSRCNCPPPTRRTTNADLLRDLRDNRIPIDSVTIHYAAETPVGTPSVTWRDLQPNAWGRDRTDSSNTDGEVIM